MLHFCYEIAMSQIQLLLNHHAHLIIIYTYLLI